MSAHEVTYKKHKRYPLDPHFIPICASCGPLDEPRDHDDARRTGRRHEAAMSSDVVAAEVDHA